MRQSHPELPCSCDSIDGPDPDCQFHNTPLTRRKSDYPKVQFIAYVYNDPGEAPVLDVSHTLEECRERVIEAGCGFIYRLERLTMKGKNGLPEYGNEQFIEAIS
jgi:hypothetical protein